MTFFHIFAMRTRAQVHDIATMTRSNRCLLKFYLRNSNFATLKRQHEGKVCNGICTGRLIPAGNMAANHKLRCGAIVLSMLRRCEGLNCG